MPIIKLGEAINITAADIQPVENVLADPEIVERFKKFAAGLKTIAPMAKDFLYFTAVMMHAAEAALLNSDGSLKKDASGNELTARWDKVGDGVRWVCSDHNIRPYKNNNNDIFPESELITAHKKWIGRPLCLDHKSSSVDAIRGVIVDTYYDRTHKRVIALCALDKVNYPDLARKVSTGYAASVSMGTAVGRAVCSDCHRVARVESDFCDHMRSKSCYGEINLDLSPIELSIVVNGADPQAKIKHIIAKDLSKAAEHIADYKKKVSEGNVSQDELAAIQKDLQSLSERVSKLVQAAQSEDDSNETNYGTTGSAKGMEPDLQTDPSGTQIQGPQNALVMWNSEVTDLREKLSSLQNEFNKLAMSINKNNEESTMSNEKKAYYQGTEEPTPGQPRYPKEDYETIRDSQDKQMVGQPPFPEVGPVDGMHPGYQSFGESEEGRKRRLQRLAEVKERAMRRSAALEKAKENFEKGKEAYFQGTEEPKPGQVQYPNEVDYRKIRDNEDKQMVGQSPFPDVGPVDGLHPSPSSADLADELKRKQMLSRAKLNGKFVKAVTADGKADLGNSRWDVYANDRLILSAKVDEITGGNTTDVLFNSIATKNFGEGILTKIRTEGFDATKAALVKSAQPAPAMGAPGTPPPVGGTPPMGGAPVGDLEPPPMDEPEGAGEPANQVKEIIADLRDMLKAATERADDLEEAYDTMKGEVPELADVEPAAEGEFAEGKVASVESLQGMRKTLNNMLREALQEAVTQLRAHAEELKLTDSIYSNKLSNLNAEQCKYLNSLASDAITDAKHTLADSYKLMGAYVKYAHGTESLLKRAEAEKGLSKQADGDDMPSSMKDNEGGMDGDSYPTSHGDAKSQDVKPDEGVQSAKPSNVDNGVAADGNNDDVVMPGGHIVSDPGKGLMPELLEKMPPAEDPFSDAARKRMEEIENPEAGKPKYDPSEMFGEGLEGPGGLNLSSADDGNEAKLQVKPGEPVPPDAPAGIEVEIAASDDLSTKEGRAAWRVKMAQKGMQYSDILQKAHPKGGHTPEMMDTKPAGDLMHVEDLVEAKEKHMAVVNMAPKARKQAEQIAKLVSEGKLQPEQVNSLVAHGVDPEAAKYWKAFYGEAKDPESKEFANKLVQEHGKAKVAEEMEKREVRIKRAYDLAYEMANKGIIEQNQIKDQVDEILKWNDEAFDSTKRIIAKQASMKKQAMPQVGLLHSGDVILPAAERSESQENLAQVFEGYFAGRKF